MHVDALDDLRERTAKAANPSMLTEADRKRKLPPTLKQDYMANKHAVMALENAMKSSLPDGTLSELVIDNAPRQLVHGERRYIVDVEDLDEDVKNLSPDRTHRVCIEQADGVTRY